MIKTFKFPQHDAFCDSISSEHELTLSKLNEVLECTGFTYKENRSHLVLNDIIKMGYAEDERYSNYILWRAWDIKDQAKVLEARKKGTTEAILEIYYTLRIQVEYLYTAEEI